MAGFFGFLDFTKEGPGVRKDAPKKKAFFAFFETYFRNIGRFVSVNLLYFALSLPVLTGGLACSGITHITRNIARDKHSFGISDYFSTIKKNWKQALSVGIINAVISAIMVFAIYIYYTSYTNAETKSMFHLVGFAVSLSMALVFSIMKFYIYTLMITFDFSLKALYKNSFKFVFVNFWKNMLCIILLLLVYALYIFIALIAADSFGNNGLRVWIIEFVIVVATFPAFKYLLIQFCTFGSIKKYIIDPYYAQHPDADIEKRRSLGLDVPDETEEEPLSWE